MRIPLLTLIRRIQTVWKDDHVLDSILDAYLSLGRCIANFDDYHDLVENSIYIQGAVADFYEDLAEFHGKAIRILSGRGELVKFSYFHGHIVQKYCAVPVNILNRDHISFRGRCSLV